MFRGRRVDIDERDVVSLEKVERLRKLFLGDPVAVSKFDRQPVIGRRFYNLIELLQAMFAGRECGRKLEEQCAQFAVSSQRFDRSQEYLGYFFFYFRRQFYPPFFVGLRAALQRWRQELCLRAMTRKQ